MAPEVDLVRMTEVRDAAADALLMVARWRSGISIWLSREKEIAP